MALLLQRITFGDQRAFAELVDAYPRPLFGFSDRMGIRQVQAEDAA